MKQTILAGILIFSIFVLGVVAGYSYAPTTEDIVQETIREMKILDGSSLRGMMNEAKYSPGRALDFATDYPTYAYLFNGSYVTYVDN